MVGTVYQICNSCFLLAYFLIEIINMYMAPSSDLSATLFVVKFTGNLKLPLRKIKDFLSVDSLLKPNSRNKIHLNSTLCISYLTPLYFKLLFLIYPAV